MADSDSDQAGVPLIEDLSDSPAPPSSAVKRKRPAGDDADELQRKAAKRAKRKAKRHAAAAVDESMLDAQLGINRAVGLMDPALLADHLAQRTRRYQPELSGVESDDLRLPASAIVDTTAFTEARTTERIADFLEQFAGAAGAGAEEGAKSTPSEKKKKKKPHKTAHHHALATAAPTPGSPHTLVVAASGLRAADLTRALRRFQTKDALVAKLFAKHIKLHEAIATVGATRMSMGVGTPQRVLDLLDDGCLKAGDGALRRVVVDASHVDAKKRGIMDMRETVAPLARLLGSRHLRDHGAGGTTGGVEVLFY